MLASRNQYISNTHEQLQVISQDDKKRMEYEAREKAIRDYNQLIYESTETGRQQGQIELILNCLKKGKTCEQVSEFLEIPLEDIKQIQENDAL